MKNRKEVKDTEHTNASRALRRLNYYAFKLEFNNVDRDFRREFDLPENPANPTTYFDRQLWEETLSSDTVRCRKFELRLTAIMKKVNIPRELRGWLTEYLISGVYVFPSLDEVLIKFVYNPNTEEKELWLKIPASLPTTTIRDMLKSIAVYQKKLPDYKGALKEHPYLREQREIYRWYKEDPDIEKIISRAKDELGYIIGDDVSARNIISRFKKAMTV